MLDQVSQADEDFDDDDDLRNVTMVPYLQRRDREIHAYMPPPEAQPNRLKPVRPPLKELADFDKALVNIPMYKQMMDKFISPKKRFVYLWQITRYGTKNQTLFLKLKFFLGSYRSVSEQGMQAIISSFKVMGGIVSDDRVNPFILKLLKEDEKIYTGIFFLKVWPTLVSFLSS